MKTSVPFATPSCWNPSEASNWICKKNLDRSASDDECKARDFENLTESCVYVECISRQTQQGIGARSTVKTCLDMAVQFI